MSVKPNYKIIIISAILIFALFGVMTFLFDQEIINPFHRGVLIDVFICVILAVSLNLSAGFLGQLVLSHAAFMAVGAYTSAIFTTRLGITSIHGFLLALIVGGLAAALAGFIIGVPALRLRGDYIAIVTLGFGLIVVSILNNLEVITGGPLGLRVPRLTTLTIAYFVMVAVVAMLVALVRSRHGRAMIAIREDEIAAEASGIPTTFYKILGFVIAAFFAGVAGGLFSHNVRFITPDAFTFTQSIEYLIIVVLGGMGSFTGSILAAIVLTILPEALRVFEDYRMLTYSVLLIAMMIFRPKGLMGTYEFSLVKIFNFSQKIIKKKG
jgi:branched-chain amino acid transport system permease protein